MIYLPFEMGYLTKEMVAIAERELGETDEVRREALIELRKLLKEETKLVCRDDEEYLEQFLRARKFNVKRTFSLLLNYYHVKKHHNEVYTYDFSGFKKAFSSKTISVLPYRDPDGSVIMVFKLTNWNFNERKFSAVVHDLTIAIMFFVEDVATQVCGIKIIVDVGGLSLGHMKNAHPKYIHLIGKGLKNCLPARFKAIHVINESFIFQYFWSVLKLVLSEKLRNRVHFHSTSLESLHNYFSPELLPVEYGGKYTLDNRAVLKKVETLEHVYNEKMSLGYKSRKGNVEECPGS